MNSLVLLFMSVLVSSGMLKATLFGHLSIPVEHFRVSVRLVEIQSDGGRSVSHANHIPVKRDGTCHIEFKKGNENSHTWNVQLKRDRNQHLEAEVSVTRTKTETSFGFFAVQHVQTYREQSQVKIGQIHRWVQTRDADRLPTSWIEFTVEQPLRLPALVPSGPGAAEESEVYPFYYEPF